MAYEIRDNTGSLFANDKKVEGDNKPGRTGRAMVGGVEYWVSGWDKDGSNSGPWVSLKFEKIVPRGEEDDAPLFSKAK